ncbi:MAG: isoaspartyl peptidase/L-asparaginase [Pirellulales bacterium]
MTNHTLPLALLLTFLPNMTYAADAIPDVVLAIHGGTATQVDEADRPFAQQMRQDMEKALKAGHAAMHKAGGTSLDGVEAAVRVLEDSPHFNAGKGAVFTREGQNELDASIMEGRTKKGGAVASVKVIKNPISAARAVMEHTPHVLLGGRGAEVFASQQGLEIVDPSYFWTERKWKQIEEYWKKESDAKKAGGTPRVFDGREAGTIPSTPFVDSGRATQDYEWGTVGAVALDSEKDLAAATSTGGLNGKMYGRIGDSPILGAGTYADNEACAVSGTGQGEYFIRLAIGHEIAALMKYKGLSVDAAAKEAVGQITEAGGPGAVIALDAKGNFTAPYNTPGLHHGYIARDGQVKVMLYDEQ